jgi:3-phosphoshikimate 1-carboxyvinyltransferase
MAKAVEVHDGAIDATVRPPGSKSLTIRALACAALSNGQSTLLQPLDSEDTVAAREAFRNLGVSIEEQDGAWVIDGVGKGFRAPDAPLDAGASGLTARILLGIAPLIPGETVLVGRDRLPQRPFGGLVESLRTQGVTVGSADGRMPLTVSGSGQIRGGAVSVDVSDSTQFATALMIAAAHANSETSVTVEGLVGSDGYLDLTADVMADFGVDVSRDGGTVHVPNTGYRANPALAIEADASAAVYPMLAAALCGGRVDIEGLGMESRQPDFKIGSVLARMGCTVVRTPDMTSVFGPGSGLRGVDIDLSGSPDGALAIAAAAVVAKGPSHLHGLGSLRHKESDRLEALATEINRLGAVADIEDDTLVITPGEISPTTIKTYSDHRMAMSFAMLGLVADSIEIEDPDVVNKTWPGFWSMLEAL